jgi:hypothetical protein
MNPGDFARLLARVEAGGFEAIADELDDEAVELTYAQAADLAEAHCWRAFPFVGDYVHWLEGRVRDRAQSVECQREARCRMGFLGAPCNQCEPFWGRRPLGPPGPEARMDSDDWGAPRFSKAESTDT